MTNRMIYRPPVSAGISREGKLAALLAAVVVAVTLLNGAGVFLKRTGVVDRPAYERYLAVHHAAGPHGRGPLPTAQYRRELPYRAYLFQAEGVGVFLKLLKDAVVAILLTVSAVCLSRRVATLPPLRSAWPGYLLTALCAVSFLLTAQRHGSLLPLTGLRAFSFLALALAGGWLARRTFTKALAVAAAALLAVETVAVCFEALRGLPIYGYLSVAASIPARLVGTFDRPNSLGVWAVLAFAFYVSYGRPSNFIWLFIFLTIVLLFASGSGTGFVVLAFLGAGAALQRLGRRALVPAGVAVIAAMILLLPAIIGRPELFDSLTGRLEELLLVFKGLDGIEALTGKAFGAGTSVAFQLFRSGGPFEIADPGQVFTASAESLPTLLLLGTGIPGLAAFYMMLLWAAAKDPPGRPFLIAVFLTSLTGKVVEIFPVNLFLAAVLARSFLNRDSALFIKSGAVPI